MERTGLERRIPAAILDALFLGIITTIAVVGYAVIGGTKLALRVQDALGVPITLSSVASEEVWNQYERKAEELADRMERRFREEFTDEQAAFIEARVQDAMADYFIPESLSLEYFLTIDENRLNEMIDTAFDAVVDSGRSDIDPAVVNELRAGTKEIVDEFALGKIVPAAIDFAIWLALVPVIVALLYGLSEGVWGRTLGKVALGIGIRNHDGERAFAHLLLLRFAIKYAPMLLMVAALITRLEGMVVAAGISGAIVAVGSLAMLGPERRAMHDYLAGTAVYRMRERGDW